MHESADKIKSTFWFYGYQTRVKACVMTECQSFNGVLQIVRARRLPTAHIPTTHNAINSCVRVYAARCCTLLLILVFGGASAGLH